MCPDPSAREVALLAGATPSPEPGEGSAYLQGACADNPPPPAAVDPRLAALSPGTQVGVWQVVGVADGGAALVVTRLTGVPRKGLLHLAPVTAAGALSHPAIVRRLDAGVTADAVAFVVVEDVDGMPVEAYCDTYTLTIADRLHIVRAICAGLQHAHAHGVTHGAIGGTSVAVSSSGVPTWTDLGLSAAEAVSAADGRAAIAADIRGLGALLCGLLAGRRPASGEVMRPSAFARADTLGTAAAARRTSAPALVARLSGDLDAIVLRALTTDEATGYTSVEALAADLERHRTHHPVEARGRGWRYVTGRFARRHAVSLALLAVAAALLLAAA